MATVDVKAITVDVTVVNTLLAFVDIGATDSIAAVAIDARASKSSDAIRASCLSVTPSFAVCTFIDIDTLAIAKHKSRQASAVEGTRIVYAK